MYRQTPLVVFHLLFSFMRSPIIEHNSIFFQFVSTLSFSFWLIIFWLLKMITSSPEAVKQFWVFIGNFFPPEIEFSVAIIGVKMNSVPEKMMYHNHPILLPKRDKCIEADILWQNDERQKSNYLLVLGFEPTTIRLMSPYMVLHSL